MALALGPLVTPGELAEVLEELKAREPLFHHRDLVHSAETFDRETREDFWEVGASGRVYSRNAVREAVVTRCATSPVDEMVVEGWTTRDHQVVAVAQNVYLFAYELEQGERVTRRASVWTRTEDARWRVLYHQGTIVRGG